MNFGAGLTALLLLFLTVLSQPSTLNLDSSDSDYDENPDLAWIFVEILSPRQKQEVGEDVFLAFTLHNAALETACRTAIYLDFSLFGFHAGCDHVVQFTNLTAGEHRVDVILCDENQRLQSQQMSVEFIVTHSHQVSAQEVSLIYPYDGQLTDVDRNTNLKIFYWVHEKYLLDDGASAVLSLEDSCSGDRLWSVALDMSHRFGVVVVPEGMLDFILELRIDGEVIDTSAVTFEVDFLPVFEVGSEVEVKVDGEMVEGRVVALQGRLAEVQVVKEDGSGKVYPCELDDLAPLATRRRREWEEVDVPPLERLTQSYERDFYPGNTERAPGSAQYHVFWPSTGFPARKDDATHDREYYNNTNTLRVWFEDFWDYFNYTDNYFLWALHSAYPSHAIVVDRFHPHIIFFSQYPAVSKGLYKHAGVVFVSISSEPGFIAGHEPFDIFLSQFYSSYSGRGVRWPWWAGHFMHTQNHRPSMLIKPDDYDAQSILDSKEHFCVFLVRNCGQPMRNVMMQLLNDTYKFVHSPGSCMQNTWAEDEIPPQTVRWICNCYTDKIKYMRRFKFALVFENTQEPGYLSEKLVDCMIANTVCVYWGDPTVARQFNTKSFISAYDFNSLEEIVERIKYLDTHDDEYLKVLSEPFLLDNNTLSPDRFPFVYDELFMAHGIAPSLNVLLECERRQLARGVVKRPPIKLTGSQLFAGVAEFWAVSLGRFLHVSQEGDRPFLEISEVMPHRGWTLLVDDADSDGAVQFGHDVLVKASNGMFVRVDDDGYFVADVADRENAMWLAVMDGGLSGKAKARRRLQLAVSSVEGADYAVAAADGRFVLGPQRNAAVFEPVHVPPVLRAREEL